MLEERKTFMKQGMKYLIACLMCFSLVACGDTKENKEPTPSETPVASVEPTSAPEVASLSEEQEMTLRDICTEIDQVHPGSAGSSLRLARVLGSLLNDGEVFLIDGEKTMTMLEDTCTNLLKEKDQYQDFLKSLDALQLEYFSDPANKKEMIEESGIQLKDDLLTQAKIEQIIRILQSVA